MRKKWPNAILIHTPVHASWLNQVEIYFSIVKRKLLWPNLNSVFLPSSATMSETIKWPLSHRDLPIPLTEHDGKLLAPAA